MSDTAAIEQHGFTYVLGPASSLKRTDEICGICEVDHKLERIRRESASMNPVTELLVCNFILNAPAEERADGGDSGGNQEV